jgi:hypothetical protein
MAAPSQPNSPTPDPFDRNFFAVTLADLLAKKGASLHQLGRAAISTPAIHRLEAGLTSALQECSLNPVQLRLISSRFGFEEDKKLLLYASSIATSAQRYLIQLYLPYARAWAVTQEICDMIVPRLAQQRDFMTMIRMLEEGTADLPATDELLRPIAALYEDGALSRIGAQFISDPILQQDLLQRALLSLSSAAARFKDLPDGVKKSEEGIFWHDLIRDAISELQSDGVRLPDPNVDF